MQLTKQSIGVLSALAFLSVIGIIAIFNSEGGDRLEIQAVYDQFDNNRQLSVEDDHTARKLIVELAGNKTLEQRDPDRWAVSVYCFIICFSNNISVGVIIHYTITCLQLYTSIFSPLFAIHNITETSITIKRYRRSRAR